MKRILAAAFGVVLGFALLAPVKGELLAHAMCSGDVDSIYAQLQDRGWTREKVEFVAAQFECADSVIRGAFVSPQWNVVIVINVDADYYLLTYDAFGKLLSIQ